MNRRAATAALCALTLFGCSDSPDYSPEGRVWKEMIYEQFALDIDPSTANCFADEVGSVEYTVGPLFDERPDDETPGSVWKAVDECMSDNEQDSLARALALGGWSFEDPRYEETWEAAASTIGGCVRDAGGWETLGSFQQFLSTCQQSITSITTKGASQS